MTVLRQTPMATRMRNLAEADNLPADHQLRTLADQFDHVNAGFFAVPQTVFAREFLGVWARARVALCSYTGERLV